MKRRALAAALLTLALSATTACQADAGEPDLAVPAGSVTDLGGPPDIDDPDVNAAATVDSWLYQLTNYAGDKLDAVAAAPHDAAVIDLARDGGEGYWTATEIGAVQATGKQVFSYFSMGSIETYRPEYDDVAEVPGLILNHWPDWPEEYFVAYWFEEWWTLVVKPRLDTALAAGFDGAYLDVPNAYEEIDLALVPGETRETLGRKMVDQIIRISEYAKSVRPGFMVLPQNSPELAEFDGYVGAVDGLGVEELFYLDEDQPCDEDWCQENLDATRHLRDQGKLILAVDYAVDPGNIADACARYAEEGFAGYVTRVDLDAIDPHC